jgi:hypothetical protein
MAEWSGLSTYDPGFTPPRRKRMISCSRVRWHSSPTRLSPASRQRASRSPCPRSPSVWRAVGWSRQPPTNCHQPLRAELVWPRRISAQLQRIGPRAGCAPAWVSATGCRCAAGWVAGCPSMHERAQVNHVAGLVGRTHLGRGVQPPAKRGREAPFRRGQKVLGGLVLTPENCP